MVDTKPSINMLHKTYHTKSCILSYRVGSDPVTTSFLVGWIKKTRNIPS